MSDARIHATVAGRLSDFLDGELDEARRAEVEAHLSGCGECRALLDDLRRVVSAARALGERTPPRDLWPGIAARLQPKPSAAERAETSPEGPIQAPVETPVAAPVPRGPGRVTRRRLVITMPQLAAAAVLLVALTSSATWWAGALRAPAGPDVGAEVAGSAPGAAPSSGPRAATAVSEPTVVPEPIASELAVLEAVLDAGREVLDPTTVLVLERNLAVIERAIEESRGALALDPGSDFLAGHLARAYERKLEYLRDVSRIVEFAG